MAYRCHDDSHPRCCLRSHHLFSHKARMDRASNEEYRRPSRSCHSSHQEANPVSIVRFWVAAVADMLLASLCAPSQRSIKRVPYRMAWYQYNTLVFYLHLHHKTGETPRCALSSGDSGLGCGDVWCDGQLKININTFSSTYKFISF